MCSLRLGKFQTTPTCTIETQTSAQKLCKNTSTHTHLDSLSKRQISNTYITSTHSQGILWTLQSREKSCSKISTCTQLAWNTMRRNTHTFLRKIRVHRDPENRGSLATLAWKTHNLPAQKSSVDVLNNADAPPGVIPMCCAIPRTLPHQLHNPSRRVRSATLTRSRPHSRAETSARRARIPRVFSRGRAEREVWLRRSSSPKNRGEFTRRQARLWGDRNWLPADYEFWLLFNSPRDKLWILPESPDHVFDIWLTCVK